MTVTVPVSRYDQLRQMVAGMDGPAIRRFAGTLIDPADLALLEQAVASLSHEYWAADAVRWAAESVRWDGDSLAPYQAEILARLPVEHRLAVRGPHSLGKVRARP